MVVDEHPILEAVYIFNKIKCAHLVCHLNITDKYSHFPVAIKFGHALTLNILTYGLKHVWYRELQFGNVVLNLCSKIFQIY